MMRCSVVISGVVVLIGLSTTARAQATGDWSVSAAQGYQEHIVSNGPGNSFNISCDVGASDPGKEKAPSLFVEIVGKPPKPHTFVDVFAIDTVFRLPVNDRGLIDTECRVCASSFAALWYKLRKSNAIVVQYADGMNSSFKTAGGAKALAPKPCTAGVGR